MGVVGVISGREAREKLNKGVQTLVRAVSSTLGANGSNVTLVDNLNPPRVTKDGVTVAKSIRLYDYVENAGADIVKQASISSAEIAGDGTTTSTVLAGAILNECMNIPENSKKYDIRSGMSKAVDTIVKDLKKQSLNVLNNPTLLKKIGTTSANNNPEIGTLVADVVTKFGNKATIHLSKEMRDTTFVSEVVGYTYSKGLVTEHLTQVDGDVFSKIENSKILVVDDNLNNFAVVAPVIEYCISNKLPLVIMANKVGQEFLTIALQNLYQKALSVNSFAIVETPNFNERRTDSLKDILRCTNATLFSMDEHGGKNIKDFSPEDLGDLKMFEATDDKTTFVFTESGEEVAKDICKNLIVIF